MCQSLPWGCPDRGAQAALDAAFAHQSISVGRQARLNPCCECLEVLFSAVIGCAPVLAEAAVHKCACTHCKLLALQQLR